MSEKPKTENVNGKSKKAKHFFKTFGKVLLLILSCIWELIMAILFIDFITGLTSKHKNK